MGVHLHRTWSINHICAAEIPWVWRDDARGGGGRRNSLHLISLKFTGRSFNHLESVRGCAATGADQESVFNVPHSSERSNHTGRHAEAFSQRGARVDLLSHLTALMSSELWLQLYCWTQEGGGGEVGRTEHTRGFQRRAVDVRFICFFSWHDLSWFTAVRKSERVNRKDADQERAKPRIAALALKSVGYQTSPLETPQRLRSYGKES